MTLGLYTPSAVALVVLAQWPQATEIVYSRRCSKNVSRISWASPASLLAWFRYRALSWNVTTMGERHGFHSTQSSHIPQSAKLAVCSGPSWCMWG